MTLNDLITKLEQIRFEHGGELPCFTTSYGNAIGRGMPELIKTEARPRVMELTADDKKVLL